MASGPPVMVDQVTKQDARSVNPTPNPNCDAGGLPRQLPVPTRADGCDTIVTTRRICNGSSSPSSAAGCWYGWWRHGPPFQIPPRARAQRTGCGSSRAALCTRWPCGT
eukprot:1193236-Prorocentrum_minimum.AAC.2